MYYTVPSRYNSLALSSFHPCYLRRSYSYPYSRRYADFAFNPFGAVASVASVGPALSSAYRAQKKLKAMGSSPMKRIRGGIQHGFGKYLDGTHDSSLAAAGARSAYKGGRSALRSVKRAAPNTGRRAKAMGAAKAFGSKATGSLRKSASGFALNTVRNPISHVTSPISDVAKVYKAVRPKGYKLPGTRSGAGSRMMGGLRRAGNVLGIG